MQVTIAAWPWGAYLGEDALENGVDGFQDGSARGNGRVAQIQAAPDPATGPRFPAVGV